VTAFIHADDDFTVERDGPRLFGIDVMAVVARDQAKIVDELSTMREPV
jgi:predicted nucleotidyltransferase